MALTWDGTHEEDVWPASCEAADAKNMESVVCQKEVIKVSLKTKKKTEENNTREPMDDGKAQKDLKLVVAWTIALKQKQWF